jgi:hypothetical protein
MYVLRQAFDDGGFRSVHQDEKHDNKRFTVGGFCVLNDVQNMLQKEFLAMITNSNIRRQPSFEQS